MRLHDQIAVRDAVLLEAKAVGMGACLGAHSIAASTFYSRLNPNIHEHQWTLANAWDHCQLVRQKLGQPSMMLRLLAEANDCILVRREHPGDAGPDGLLRIAVPPVWYAARALDAIREAMLPESDGGENITPAEAAGIAACLGQLAGGAYQVHDAVLAAAMWPEDERRRSV